MFNSFLLSTKCSLWLNPLPPLFVRINHKFRKSPSILHQRVRASASDEPFLPFVRKMSALDNPLLSDCKRLYGAILVDISLKNNCFKQKNATTYRLLNRLYLYLHLSTHIC